MKVMSDLNKRISEAMYEYGLSIGAKSHTTYNTHGNTLFSRCIFKDENGVALVTVDKANLQEAMAIGDAHKEKSEINWQTYNPATHRVVARKP